MIAGKLLTAVAAATVILFFLELAQLLLGKWIARLFNLTHRLQVQFWAPFFLNLVFVVMIPAIVYASLYPILPFSGYRSGLFIGLFVFTVGVVPVKIRTFNQYSLPIGMTAFQLLWTLLTLLLVIGSITLIHNY